MYSMNIRASVAFAPTGTPKLSVDPYWAGFDSSSTVMNCEFSARNAGLSAHSAHVGGFAGSSPASSSRMCVEKSSIAAVPFRYAARALGTQPGTPSSTEAVESIFLAAGCQLVEDGEVTIDSDECTDAAAGFKRLADSSLAGQFDVPSAMPETPVS